MRQKVSNRVDQKVLKWIGHVERMNEEEKTEGVTTRKWRVEKLKAGLARGTSTESETSALLSY